MSILIFTVPGDAHALAVEWGIRKIGGSVEMVYPSNLSQEGALNIQISPNNKSTIQIIDKNRIIDLEKFSTIWFRRMADPVISDKCHPSDVIPARRDWRAALHAVEHSGIFNQRRCVNPPSSSLKRDIKFRQIEIAKEAGIRIPNTLISNNPDHIRRFVSKNHQRGRETIVKPLSLSIWFKDDNSVSVPVTSKINSDDLRNADLSISPAIYQELIFPKVDVRLTQFGEDMVAIKLHGGKNIDYRHTLDYTTLSAGIIDIPPYIREAILQFAKLTGTVFNAMDFVIGEDGEWIFLETNPAGSFLWVDECVPEARLLDKFCRFLVGVESEGDISESCIELSDFVYDCGSLEDIAFRDAEQSIRVPNSAFISE